MSKKIIAIVCVVAVLAIGGVLFFVLKDNNKNEVPAGNEVVENNQGSGEELVVTQPAETTPAVITPEETTPADITPTETEEDVISGATNEAWINALCKHTGCNAEAIAPDYDKEKHVTGYFIAVTAMKAIGDYKLSKLVGDEWGYSDEEYFKLAVTKNFISESAKEKYFTEDEFENLLFTYDDLYFGDFWADDYVNVEYKDTVTELVSDKDFVLEDDLGKIYFENSDGFDVGSIIIYNDKDGFKHALTITENNGDDTYSVENAKPEEVFEVFELSDKTSVSFGEVVASYVNGNGGVVKPHSSKTANSFQNLLATNQDMVPNSENVFNYDGVFAGAFLKIGIEEDEESGKKYLEVSFESSDEEDHLTLVKYRADDNAFGELKIGIDDINVAVETNFFAFDRKPLYAEFTASTKATIEGNLSLETDDDDLKIELFSFDIPFEGGFVRLSISAYLQLNAKGEFEIVFEIPASFCARYEKGKGIENMNSIGEPAITSSLNAEVELSLNIEPKLYVFWVWDILTVKISGGTLAQASETLQDDGMLCTDIGIYFPFVKAGLSVNGIFDTLDFEWDIISAEDHKIWGYHYEIRPSGWKGRVDECTYGTDFDENTDGGETVENPDDESSESDVDESVDGETDTDESTDGESNTDENTDGESLEYADISFLYGRPFFSTFVMNEEISPEKDEATGESFAVGKIIYETVLTYDEYENIKDRGIDWGNHTEEPDINPGDVVITYAGNDTKFKVYGKKLSVVSYRMNGMGRTCLTLIDKKGAKYSFRDETSGMFELEGAKMSDENGRYQFEVENARICVPSEFGDLRGSESFMITFDEEGRVNELRLR